MSAVRGTAAGAAAFLVLSVLLVGVLVATVPGIADAITDKASELIRGVG
jgi:hypothetical protein